MNPGISLWWLGGIGVKCHGMELGAVRYGMVRRGEARRGTARYGNTIKYNPSAFLE